MPLSPEGRIGVAAPHPPPAKRWGRREEGGGGLKFD